MARLVRTTVAVVMAALFLAGAVAPASARRATTPQPPHELGIATFNAYQDLRPWRAWSDIDRITNRWDVDVIGWQEAENNARLFERLRRTKEWDTVTYPGARGANAVSWRRSRLSLVSSTPVVVHRGNSAGRHPFPAGR